jgi:hypothetical protein
MGGQKSPSKAAVVKPAAIPALVLLALFGAITGASWYVMDVVEEKMLVEGSPAVSAVVYISAFEPSIALVSSTFRSFTSGISVDSDEKVSVVL